MMLPAAATEIKAEKKEADNRKQKTKQTGTNTHGKLSIKIGRTARSKNVMTTDCTTRWNLDANETPRARTYQAKLARGTDGRQISKDMKRYYRLRPPDSKKRMRD
jgi:hypothetical protein